MQSDMLASMARIKAKESVAVDQEAAKRGGTTDAGLAGRTAAPHLLPSSYARYASPVEETHVSVAHTDSPVLPPLNPYEHHDGLQGKSGGVAATLCLGHLTCPRVLRLTTSCGFCGLQGLWNVDMLESSGNAGAREDWEGWLEIRRRVMVRAMVVLAGMFVMSSASTWSNKQQQHQLKWCKH